MFTTYWRLLVIFSLRDSFERGAMTGVLKLNSTEILCIYLHFCIYLFCLIIVNISVMSGRHLQFQKRDFSVYSS